MSDAEDNNGNSSFAVAINPEFKDGKWTGNISAHIEEELVGDLDDEDVHQIRSVCGMMTSTLYLMESEPDFLAYIQSYFLENFPETVEEMYDVALEEEEEKQAVFTRSKDGKVITLNFDTKTHGSA
jgi:hypothetical protein